MPLSHPIAKARSILTLAAVGLLLLVSLGVPVAVAADGGPTMTARALLQGHVRIGSWFAIAVDVENAGPTVTGEIRIAGGIDNRTRYGTPVELATGSRKTVLLYAQPPSFGNTMKVQLVSGDQVIAESTVAIALHDQFQLVVGVITENPAKMVGQLNLLPNQMGSLPVVVTLKPQDLPERLQAWSALDRIVWQDTDASSLTPNQLSALRGWVAGGGRLVIAGGTAGADSLNAFPDELLPYRPTSVLDIDPEVIRPVVGGVPAGATTLTAYAGDAGAGRVLATSGDRVVAADLRLGNGSVTLLGFDPTVSWMSEGDGADWGKALWRRLLPQRQGGTVSLADDSQIASAVVNLPSLALPPLAGLLVLLFGYIVLVGPVNYLVLRALDRREWAWVTAPILIVVFTAGSFGIGGVLRGSEVIVHEVAIVRGAPATDAATVQSYLGIFSPNRATLQVKVPGDALLGAPVNGDMFGGGIVNSLDILQGDPSRVRDLALGVGSMRTVRAEATTTGPRITGDLAISDGRLKGTITNGSDRALIGAAIVLGSSAQTLGDIAPGATVDVNLGLGSNPMNQGSLSDRILGQAFWDGSRMTEEQQRAMVRRSVVDQLTMDPMTGWANGLPADGAHLLSWGRDGVVPLEIENQNVRRVANVLYDVPLPYRISGTNAFKYDLLRSSIVQVTANFFSKDPWSMNMGSGTMQVSYRPVPFEGSFSPGGIKFALTFGGDFSLPGGDPATAVEGARCEPGTEGCVIPQDGLPDVEILDVRTGQWIQLAHLRQGTSYTLPDAARWIDGSTGEVQVRFVNQRSDQISFQFPLEITGTVK